MTPSQVISGQAAHTQPGHISQGQVISGQVRSRPHLYRGQHGAGGDDGQEVVRVRQGKVNEPPHPALPEALHGKVGHPPQPNEHADEDGRLGYRGGEGEGGR